MWLNGGRSTAHQQIDLTLSARGSTLEVYRRQILTSKIDPRTVRVKIFIIAIDP